MDKMEKQLQENYENALFALLMDEYAKEEGEHLLALQQELEENPDFQLPEGMEERGLKLIRKTYRKNNQKYAMRIAGKALTRVAVVVLTLNIAFGAFFVSVEAFRNKVLNMVLTYCETHTTVQFTGDSENTTVVAEDHVYTVEDFMAVLPEGYVLVSHDVNDMMETAEISGADGVQITWNVYSITTVVSMDSEDADYIAEIEICGNKGLVVEKSGMSSVLVGIDSTQKMYHIVATVDYEILVGWMNQLFE